MARPIKKGLEYFSHDVSMSDDKKIKLLEKKCGYVGYAVFLKLLEEIYKNDGYFLEVDAEELECLFHLIEIEEVFEIIEVCIQRGLFDKEKFEKYNVLTSGRIQKNYLAGTGRRNSVKFKNDYVILDENYEESFEKNTNETKNNSVNVGNNLVNVYNNSINVDDNCENVYRSTQTKEKKRKEKENKQQEEKNVVVDVVLSSALKTLEERDDIKNKKAYALKMIEDGWKPEQVEVKKQFKGFRPETIARLESYEKEGALTDKQKGNLRLHREFVSNGGIYEGNN
ncbi:MAG: DUF4373 domain-containing protein [Fusobacteriaceae bacterium]